MSEPLSGSGTATALGGATVFGLFTGTDFGIVFGAFAGALFVATMPQTLSAWRVAAHFLVSFTGLQPVFSEDDREQVIAVYGPVHARLLRQSLELISDAGEVKKK
ncbi:putative holin [Escherichia coli]